MKPLSRYLNQMSTDVVTTTPAAADGPASVADRPAFEMETPSPIIQTILWAFAACILTLVNRFLGIVVPLDRFPIWGQHVTASIYFAALLYSLMRLTRAAALLRITSPILLLTGISLALPMGYVILKQSNFADIHAQLLTLSQTAGFFKIIYIGLDRLIVSLAEVARYGPLPPPWLILSANNLFLPVGVALVGTAVGRIIRHPNTLLAAAGFALFFDIIMVTGGTVAALSSTGSQIISMVSVGAGMAIPQQAHKSWSIISGVTIGPADVLFLSVFFASVFLLRLETRATFRWIYGLLLAALLQVEWIGLPVPALAPMGIAVIVANYRHGAFTQREKRDLIIGIAFAIACAAFIVWKAQGFAAEARAKAQEERKKHIGFSQGVLPTNGLHVIIAVQPESRAMAAGLRAGDVVQKINGIPIETLSKDKEKYAMLLANGAKDGITLTIKSGDQPKPRDIVFPPADSGRPDPTPLPSTTPSP